MMLKPRRRTAPGCGFVTRPADYRATLAAGAGRLDRVTLISTAKLIAATTANKTATTVAKAVPRRSRVPLRKGERTAPGLILDLLGMSAPCIASADFAAFGDRGRVAFARLLLGIRWRRGNHPLRQLAEWQPFRGRMAASRVAKASAVQARGFRER